jgi:superfamily II DNA or RNA helicase
MFCILARTIIQISRCHLDFQSFNDQGFHSKGYIFVFNESTEVIIGSSNITRFALLRNIEWNAVFSTNINQIIYNDVMNEFNHLWQKTISLSRDIIRQYAIQLDYSIEKWDMDYYHEYVSVVPNYMQRKALKELRRYRDLGVTKALVIAATGSGKTHLAGFDARNFGAKRVLFVVHRENILRDAIHIFSSIFGNQISYGLLTGNDKNINSDFLFATNITLDKNLQLFSKTEFDYIVMDEVHHVVADTYQRIIQYFKPEFLLGLTATPDRMDQESIYQVFDKNVPFDLRLRDAILNDLVVPFHYYGIRDTLIQYDEKDINSLIRDISRDEHCEFIHQEIQKYIPSDKLKAIGFCRTVEHARQMSENMSVFGYSTTFLSGSSHIGDRISAFKQLQDEDHPLQIIFAVDILNEGVDIPGINMVLFLRPTESSIVFLQQLGRGLRKYPNKPFLTVLDFIGNSYKRSIQIIKALGTLSESTVIEKKLLIDLINEDFASLQIPNLKIQFDQLSKEEITEHISNTNFNTRDNLKSDYTNFKRYINSQSYPKHMDYLNHDFAPDLIRFLRSKLGEKNVSYYRFLQKIDETVPSFTSYQISFIDFISNMLPLIRYYEFEIISIMMEHGQMTKEQLIKRVSIKHPGLYQNQFDNAFLNLQNAFLSDTEKENSPMFFEMIDDIFVMHISFEDEEFKSYVLDTLAYGLTRFDEEIGDNTDGLKLYGNYTTEQFMMATCQSTYKYYKGTKIEKDGTVYILANLKKEESTLQHLKYKDIFLDDHRFQWESETNTTLRNHRGLIGSKIAHLFIRKMSSEDGITLPFIYIGTGQLVNPRTTDNPKNTLLFDVLLDHPIPAIFEV